MQHDRLHTYSIRSKDDSHHGEKIWRFRTQDVFCWKGLSIIRTRRSVDDRVRARRIDAGSRSRDAADAHRFASRVQRITRYEAAARPRGVPLRQASEQ